MRFRRQEDELRSLCLSGDFIAPAVLSRLYEEEFEASCVSVNPDRLALKFIEFLLVNEKARQTLPSDIPFLADILKREAAKAAIELEGITHPDPRVPWGSALRHACFSILSQAYPAIVEIGLCLPT